MTDAILIGQMIYDRLTTCSQLTEYVDGRVWPLVAPYTKPEDVVYPFIVYTKNNISVTGTSKDGYYQDTVDFNIIVESPNYADTIYIANIVRHIFEGKIIVYNTLEVDSIRMTNINEQFTDETFIQSLTFTCNVCNA